MSNEHKIHRQCQTCYVEFAENSQLFAHIEEYKVHTQTSIWAYEHIQTLYIHLSILYQKCESPRESWSRATLLTHHLRG
ncbi:hypothetical protein F5Y08DRAFT_323247 [Xylaria arbuscula]|nr:hypothetical protein F5Y08DRAFT_323247 [Xylaria arbuscula]